MTDITTPAQMREASIYYIDCEFDGHIGPLLSLAMVRGDGYSTHIRVNLDAKDPWVQANVMPIMDSHNADVSETVDLACVGQSIRDFIGTCQHPTIIADSPVDIWRFCAAISTASDGQWSSVDYPKISFAVHNVACYPTKLAGAVQHNAWWDAMALRDTLCRALPVAEPLCTWPSCNHTAKGQCNPPFGLPVAEPEPLAAKVKPLVWTAVGAALWARDIYGDHYEIEAKDEAVVIDHPRLYGDYAVASIDDAKSVAEADHAARIRSQIDAVPAAQVRAEALEEAAALPPYDCDGDPAGSFDHHVFVKRDAIRALMEKPE